MTLREPAHRFVALLDGLLATTTEQTDGVDELVRLSKQTDVLSWNGLHPQRLMYLGDSYSVGGIDQRQGGRVFTIAGAA